MKGDKTILDNELIDLDFAPGIKSEYVNHNFNVIHDWLKRERLRTAGWGLVEGFELSADVPNGVVTVGTGLMVNKNGEEVSVASKSFVVGGLDTTDMIESVIAPENGVIELKQRPYSKSAGGYFAFTGNTNKQYPITEEFFVEDLISGLQVPVIQIDGNKVTINADDWSGHELQITYQTTRDRIDSIMLYKNGDYTYEKSVVSSSPSHVELGDYDNCYMIGVVYWHVDTTTTVEFFTDHRTYRKVYVDEQNRLWLNGKLYKEAQIIYMTEPEDPAVNDIWYDSKTNSLMIWKEKDGDYGWVVMNEQYTVELRQTKIFYPDSEDYPTDNKSFRFRDDEVNLHFVPNQCALEIVVDNTPVMSDQYEEYVPASTTKDYMALGKGFDLKDPLDRATPVEVVVHHIVKAKPVRETFQRAAIFIAESHDYLTNANKKKVFETVTEYVIDDNQLEVFVDGKRLTKGVDYVEMKNSETDATAADKNSMSRYFRVIAALSEGQLITHKISKHVWSFDHLDQMIKDIEAKADSALNSIVELRTSMSNLNENVVAQIASVNNKITQLETKIGDTTTYLKKTDTISYANIPSEVKAKLMGEQISQTFAANSAITLENASLNDFFIVNYISSNMNRALIKGSEYTPTEVGSNVRIDLQPGLMTTGASVYIVGFRVGVK